MMKETFYQTSTFNIPAATAAGVYYQEVVLDSSYERCVGLAILESVAGGISAYRIGLEDKDRQYISPVHKNLLISSPEVGVFPKNRFMDLNLKAGGHKVKIAISLPSAITEDIEIDAVFLLERSAQAR